jgi:hypothetical protein
MSFVLEKPLASMVDSISRVVLNWADFRPIPSNYKKFAIIMSTDGHQPKTIPYMKMDLNEEDALQKVFDSAQRQSYAEFLSPWMRLPPDPMDNMHKAIA